MYDSKVVPVKRGRWGGLVVSPYKGSGLLDLFDHSFPSQSFPGQVTLVASNIASSYRIRLKGPRGHIDLFAKSFSADFKSRLKNLKKPMNADRSWKASWIMINTGLPTPRPVAIMKRRSMGLVKQSVFVSETIKGALDENLEIYFRNNFDLPGLTRELIREKREIIKAIGQIYRKAHSQNRVYLPDFHPHNMVIEKDSSGKPMLYLVDFDEVRFKVRKLDPIKNLSSLGRNADKIIKKMNHKSITTGDRLRFIKSYLGPGKDSPEKTSEMARLIIANWNLK